MYVYYISVINNALFAIASNTVRNKAFHDFRPGQAVVVLPHPIANTRRQSPVVHFEGQDWSSSVNFMIVLLSFCDITHFKD